MTLVNMDIRIGLGHDTHRIEMGGPMRLGGIDIECDYRLVGHSDADALLHAITDAILGAAGLGDIGEMFPDTDQVNLGRDSAEMLDIAHRQICSHRWRIVNLDCVVLAERPKLIPWKTQIRRRIADILEITPDQIGLKGKTGEKVGAIGTSQILQTMCVCLLQKHVS